MIVLFMTFKLHTYSFRATTSDQTTTNIAFGQVVYMPKLYISYILKLYTRKSIYFVQSTTSKIQVVLRMCGDFYQGRRIQEIKYKNVGYGLQSS